MAIFTSITKEGSVIIMQTNAKDNPFKFDCSKKQLYSFTGRAISTVSPILRECRTNTTVNGERLLVEAIAAYLNEGIVEYLNLIEKFIPYLDRIDSINCKKIPNECPKGYLKYIEENNLTINENTLERFKQENAVKTMTKNEQEIYELLKERHSDSYIMRHFFDFTTEKRIAFCKIFKTSMKQFYWNFGWAMESFLNSAVGSTYNQNFPRDWEKYIDANRNFEYNSKLLIELKYKERNEEIIKWESNFLSIENLSNEHFTIIVPKTMEDFTDEGKQQHNCVGNHYHDRISKHKDIIYFIRKTKNPNKSYLTNRYNTTYGEATVETKKINNAPNDDYAAMELIKEIDKMIGEILKTL